MIDLPAAGFAGVAGLANLANFGGVADFAGFADFIGAGLALDFSFGLLTRFPSSWRVLPPTPAWRVTFDGFESRAAA
jgi:hypothetical protein